MTSAPTRERQDVETMLVSDAMHHGFIGCAYETPLHRVARLMAQHRVHCVVGFGDATEGDTSVWGVVSDQDVVEGLASGELPATVGSIAATEVVTVVPDDTLRHAAQLMRDHGVSHVLVVDGRSDRPVGILSTLDIAAVVGGVHRSAVAAQSS